MPAAIDNLFNLLQHATLPLPAIEVTLLLVILTICLLFGAVRFGLITAYLFAYRWGWIIFAAQHEAEYLVGYLVFGVATGVIAIIGMLQSHSRI